MVNRSARRATLVGLGAVLAGTVLTICSGRFVSAHEPTWPAFLAYRKAMREEYWQIVSLKLTSRLEEEKVGTYNYMCTYHGTALYHTMLYCTLTLQDTQHVQPYALPSLEPTEEICVNGILLSTPGVCTYTLVVASTRNRTAILHYMMYLR